MSTFCFCNTHPSIPALIASCSYQPLNPRVKITVCFHNTHPSIPALIAGCSYQPLNPRVKITVCFHNTHPSLPALIAGYSYQPPNLRVKNTVCFHYTHPSIHVSRLQAASITLTQSSPNSRLLMSAPQSMFEDYSTLLRHSWFQIIFGGPQNEFV